MSEECGECKNFVPKRHASGRVDYKHFGHCSYVVVWPKVPMNWKPLPDKPNRAVWHDSNAEDCECYEARK